MRGLINRCPSFVAFLRNVMLAFRGLWYLTEAFLNYRLDDFGFSIRVGPCDGILVVGLETPDVIYETYGYSCSQ